MINISIAQADHGYSASRVPCKRRDLHMGRVFIVREISFPVLLISPALRFWEVVALVIASSKLFVKEHAMVSWMLTLLVSPSHYFWVGRCSSVPPLPPGREWQGQSQSRCGLILLLEIWTWRWPWWVYRQDRFNKVASKFGNGSALVQPSTI